MDYNILLEIVRYTVPSLTVFGIVYFLMNKQQNQQLQLEAIKLQREDKKNQSAFKMQAYERLIMLCERIDPVNLYLRLNVTDMNAKQLQSSMLIGIRQEVEYNYTQQLFVSQSLWKIIMMASDQIAGMVTEAGSKLSSTDDANALINLISRMENEMGSSPLFTAKTAIKNEFESIL